MATGNRHIRVGEAIRQHLAEQLVRGLKTPGVGFVTITAVEVTRDLREATVFVSVFGTPAEQKKSLDALQMAGGYLRGEVGRSLGIRHSPSLAFKLDKSVETGARVSAAIKDARASDDELARQRGDAPPPEVAAPAADIKEEGRHG